MALQKDIILTSNFGDICQFDNVYIKVNRVDFAKEAASIHYSISKVAEGRCLTNDNVTFIPVVGINAKDAIAQGYDYLKTLPEFADAVDC